MSVDDSRCSVTRKKIKLEREKNVVQKWGETKGTNRTRGRNNSE